MASRKAGRTRARGSIDELPSGGLRVRVYAGWDTVTGCRHYLTEIIKPGPRARAQAEAARTRTFNEVDERRNPRTSPTVDQLLDRYLEVIDVSASTRQTRAATSFLPGLGGRRSGRHGRDYPRSAPPGIRPRSVGFGRRVAVAGVDAPTSCYEPLGRPSFHEVSSPFDAGSSRHPVGVGW